jgi:SAM-dependent methyltransferase
MAQQNVFDNEIFFSGYKKIREREANANDLFEIPALLSLLPDLKGKRILDLGCGFGEHCKMFVQMGASRVVGIDISEKMLAVAKKENADPRIVYLHMPIENIGELEESFDVVVSSLAFHYVEDFSGVINAIAARLVPNGVFVYSQEHPLVTSHTAGDRWTRDENGEKKHVNLSNYGIEGERDATWFIEHIKIYHRTFSSIINTLVQSGFSIEQMIEPLPTPELLQRYPEHRDLFHKPDFLLLKTRKSI